VFPSENFAEKLASNFLGRRLSGLAAGKKAAGWKREFTRSLAAAAQEFLVVTESQIAEAIRGFRLRRKQLPEITVGPSRKTA